MALSVVSEGFEKAKKLLEKADGNLNALPEAVATFLIVYSAQGVIDNGGYYYFFESDWPENPPYSKFIEAYAKIGCKKQSVELSRVASSFPFEAPHMKEAKRIKYMDENFDEDAYVVKGWGDAMCGDEEIWGKLEEFYLNTKSIFA